MLIIDESHIKPAVGMKLPIPYVGKAAVYNDNIEITLGLYLIVPIEQTVADSV